MSAMTAHTAIEDEHRATPDRCWCCGATTDPAGLVHLGNHPEVAVCVRCAHSLSKWAREVEDAGRTGPLVRARNGMRRVRKAVVRHGWHHNKVIGRGLRWLGRFTP
jgi:hypothetical protein